jgi:hypothetical protein
MRIEYPKLESVITDLSLNQNYNTMGKTKELFESMMQGMMEGISIEQQMAKRMVDDEYRYSIYKKEKEKETKPKKK